MAEVATHSDEDCVIKRQVRDDTRNSANLRFRLQVCCSDPNGGATNALKGLTGPSASQLVSMTTRAFEMTLVR